MARRLEICKVVEQYIHSHKIKLSKELGVNQVTLFRAFHLLEEKGILSIQGTSGTFVVSPLQKKALQQARHHCLAIVGLNEDAFMDQERRMEICLQVAEPEGFQILNMGLSIAQLEANHDMLGNFPVDGYIFHNSRLTIPQLRFLERSHIPFVNTGILAGVSIANVVDHDHLNGYPVALRHLQALGHHRIAHIDVRVRPELQGYHQIISQAFQRCLGAYYDPSLFFHENTVDELITMGPDRFQIYAQKALHFLLNRPEPPTAIIVMSTLKAAMEMLLLQSGIRVPEELSLVYVTGTRPVVSETALFYDTDQVLKVAAERLIHLVKSNDDSRFCQMVLPVLLNPEATTAPPISLPGILQQKIQSLE